MPYTPPDAGAVNLDLGAGVPAQDALSLALEFDRDRGVALSASTADAQGTIQATALPAAATATLAAVTEDAQGAVQAGSTPAGAAATLAAVAEDAQGVIQATALPAVAVATLLAVTEDAQAAIQATALSVVATATLAAVTEDAQAAIQATALSVATTAMLAVVTEDAQGAFGAASAPPSAQVAASTDDAVAAFAVSSASGIYRPDLCATAAGSYGLQAGLHTPVAAAWTQNQRPFRQAQAGWGLSPPVSAPRQAGWNRLAAVERQAQGGYGRAGGVAGVAEGRWRWPPPVGADAGAGFGSAQKVASLAGGSWNCPLRVADACAASWRGATWVVRWIRARAGSGMPLRKAVKAWWRKAVWPEGWVRFVPTPVPPPTPPADPPIRLDFREPPPPPGLIRLDFARRRMPYLIWIGDTAIITNEVTTVRASDNAPFEMASLRISRDITQFDWEITGEIRDDASLAMLRPVNAAPQEIIATLNGHEWRFLALFCGGPRRFADASGQLQGRSPACQLSSPYFPTRSRSNAEAQPAAQICDDELLYTGFAMAYHPALLSLMTVDWVLPAGAFSYQDKARIEAIGLLASAIDAQLFADRADPVLHLAPKYPGLPRDWGALAPDVVLENDFVSIPGESLENKPEWDQVTVSGQGVGAVRSVVRLAGTAGNLGAPDVVDPLITSGLAGLERGRSILAGGGRQVRVSLEDIPLIGDIGLVEPGHLVEVREAAGTWRGLCVSTTIEAAWPKVVQHIELERHYL